MAETRFNSDRCRLEKKMQQMTDPGRYIMNVPGLGEYPSFVEDPQILPQKWGANLYTDAVQLESSLWGINRNLSKDCLGKDEYQKFSVPSAKPLSYPVNHSLFTEQSRAIMPPWTVFDQPQNRYDFLPLNPQENVCRTFENNLSTRILEKDIYVQKIDCRYFNQANNVHPGGQTKQTNFL
jgi:hypothetical protein